MNVPIDLESKEIKELIAKAAAKMPPPPRESDKKAYRKRSELEEILSESALQPIFSARYNMPTDKPPASYYVDGVQTYVPPTEPEDTDNWVEDFFGTSYWDHSFLDCHVTYSRYIPGTKYKYSQSTCPTCPIDCSLSPEAFVDDDQEVLCHAQRSNTTIWCSE